MYPGIHTGLSPRLVAMISIHKGAQAARENYEDHVPSASNVSVQPVCVRAAIPSHTKLPALELCAGPIGIDQLVAGGDQRQ